ncbi:MAG TPA: OsmC family protein [Chitinophagales bacterium]|jgi:putative redox protein|nr:OsmC family protein [Chitinophagales bacterium]HQV77232.1 OsmC family protein [Chitinophagales bacterium]HQW79731.1 OsmC family protein [Chitinophagales bacterium]HRB18748.1 OsmC family protein [Chitinophagales bacterium]HRB66386.1 OsmC family protein [Chitinophagales bacterium]
MKVEIELVNNKVHLEAKNEQGFITHMDGSPEIGGEELGARPMQLVLMALGGCSSMDVLAMLRKMREDVKGYKVTVDAERATEHPMVFTKAHIHYVFEGNLKKENVQRAIDLSMEKYCSVTHILNKTAEITHSFEITK